MGLNDIISGVKDIGAQALTAYTQIKAVNNPQPVNAAPAPPVAPVQQPVAATMKPLWQQPLVWIGGALVIVLGVLLFRK